MTYIPTDTTLDHTIALVGQVRPEWDPMLLRIILRDLAGQGLDGNDLAIAALRAAGNLDIHSPKAIGWRGPHWDHATTRPLDQVKAGLRCGVCGRREPECYAVRHAGDDHAFEPTQRKAMTRR